VPSPVISPAVNFAITLPDFLGDRNHPEASNCRFSVMV
jgi:hypothetical protein